MADIALNVQIAIPNGPKIGLSRTLGVEAFDMIDVTVPADATQQKEIQLQPGGIGKVKFLLIAADWYGTDLSNKVMPVRALPAHWTNLTCSPEVGPFRCSMPRRSPNCCSRNATTGPKAKDANVQILIGRDATP